jgi:hypothetical protein
MSQSFHHVITSLSAARDVSYMDVLDADFLFCPFAYRTGGDSIPVSLLEVTPS